MVAGPVLKRGSLLLATALLVWLALPGNFSFWPLLAVCLVPFFALLNLARSPLTAARYAFAAGMLIHLLQIYWIVPVLHQYGGLGWYLAVPAMLLLVAYMAVYPALFGLGYRLLARHAGPLLLPAAAAALWVGLDWLRSWAFGGFPWMDIGYGLWSQPRLLQSADLVGHHGHTFLIVQVNIALFLVLDRTRRWPVRLTALVPSLCLGALLAWYGVQRWHQVEDMIGAAPRVLVGVVQGNVEQTRKWSPEERLRTVRDYVRLSDGLTAVRTPSLIVWPETALPFYPRPDDLLEPAGTFVDAHGIDLLSGAPWYEVEESRTQRLIRYYNGALLMRPGAGFAFGYYKSHLVPFGEYVPLKKYLPFLAPLVEAAGDFSAGAIVAPLQSGALRAGVLICYESIFPDLGRAWVRAGANVLVNLTNDAWYGKSSAPHQSWAMSVYRSVETRRALVRSANTGISGFVDPLGRVASASGLFVEWAAAEEVALLEGTTPFVSGGHLFAPLCGAAAVVLILISALRGRRVGAWRR